MSLEDTTKNEEIIMPIKKQQAARHSLNTHKVKRLWRLILCSTNYVTT